MGACTTWNMQRNGMICDSIGMSAWLLEKKKNIFQLYVLYADCNNCIPFNEPFVLVTAFKSTTYHPRPYSCLY